MKIGITIPYASVNYSGGINVQCRMWRDGLHALGHQVDLLTPWDKFDYNSYDYVIIVGMGNSYLNYVSLLKQFENIKIISAPVLDPNDTPLWKFKLKKYYGISSLKLSYYMNDYYKCIKDISFFLARSEFERQYIIKGFNIPADKVKIVPISIRYTESPFINYKEKEEVCLHVSRLKDPGKNVQRLVKAAQKYGFKLRLAGTINGKLEADWLQNLIGDSENITYLGWLSEEDLKQEYRKAKVFALPSIIEGVGMVALEAAIYGNEICITNLGGPKEYYDGRAVLVNPYDVDSIGQGVLYAMNNKNAQPELSQYIAEEYSVINCMRKLEKCMVDFLER